MNVVCRVVSLACLASLALRIQHTDAAIAKQNHAEKIFENIVKVRNEIVTDTHFQPKSVYGSGESIRPQVQTTSGLLSGITTDEAHQFHNVPYAKPPLDNLRFMPPKAYKPVNATDPLDVSINTGLACPQKNETCDEGVCFTNNKEDCLILEISVPSTLDLSDAVRPPSEKLPVLLWIYGGFFYAGSATNQQQNGRYLSNYTNTIVVGSNFRVGPFGFLYYHDNTGDEIPGNQGLRDQQLALQWVQDNIGKFGGDKSKVTIFGESAGAQAVMFHLLSKTSQPLFQNAIMESNPAIFPYQTPKEAAVITESLMDIIGCKEYTIKCLRNATMDQLVGAQELVIEQAVKDSDTFSSIEPYRPIIDGNEFSEQPLNLFKQGLWNSEKNVIIGTNTQELAYVNAVFEKLNVSNSRVVLNRANKFLFGEDLSKEVSQEYIDLSNSTDGNWSSDDYTTILAVELTDGFFICPTRSITRFMSETSKGGSVYLYSNAYALGGPACEEVTVNLPEVCGYAFHDSELGFVFRTGPSYGMNFTQNDETIANMFSAYWGDFAYSGNPSQCNNFTTWPPYLFSSQSSASPCNESNIEINVPDSSVEINYKKDICDFWDTTGLYTSTLDTSSTTVKTSTNPQKSTTTVTQSSTTSDAQTLLPTKIALLSSVCLFRGIIAV